MDLNNLTIKKFHQGLVNKEFSASEITEEYFSRIEKEDVKINAYLSLNKDGALESAKEIDDKIINGEDIGLIDGVPMAIKDSILIKGLPATAASKILENYKASYDATVISKLKKAGVVVLGKTNMDEFAMGSSTENSAFKITKNPRDLERVPGGTSGGSAAVIASDMAIVSLGSDTGGSIRQPASFCGVIGLKPTYGAVSRFGLMATASSLDQIGPLGKTVEDTAILFDVIRGKDENDSTSVDKDYEDSILNPDFEKVKKLKIGLPKEYFGGGLDNHTQKAINSAIDNLKSLGFEFKEISLPYTKYALSCYYIIMLAEVSANLARFDGIRYSRIKNEEFNIKNLKDIYFKQKGIGFGAEAIRRILLGTFVLSSGYYDAYYSKAQKVRRLIKEDFDRAFDLSAGGVDVILTPVSPTPAFKIGEKIDDPLSMYLSDIFTISLNLAGLPGVSIPVKGVEGLPVGFQLIGKYFKESDILGIGRVYENS